MSNADQPIPISELSISRLVSKEFKPKPAPVVRWLTLPGKQDVVGYTTTEKSHSGPDASDIVRYELRGRAPTVIVSAAQLTPRGAEKPLAIDGYELSPDQTQMLLYTNAQKVWRQKTRGDYWLLNLKTHELRQLGPKPPDASQTIEPATLMFASFSPDGRKVAYLRRDLGAVHMATNLYVEDMATATITALTSAAGIRGTDSSGRTIINGTGDWVNEEEFGLRKAYEWSPDGQHIAYWQSDATAVKDFFLINNTDTVYPVVTAVPYPKTGTANSSVRIGIVSSSGGPTNWLNLSDDPSNHYIARLAWTLDSKELLLQHFDRPQHKLDLLAADAISGAVRPLLKESSTAWVDVVDDLRWLGDGREFLWVSERDGWRRAYAGSRIDGAMKPLTPDRLDATRISGIDAAGGWLYYIASPGDATQRFLYRTHLDGTGSPQRLTPPGARGVRSYDISPDGKWAVHTSSTLDSPPMAELVSLPDHQISRVLEDNASIRTQLGKLLTRPVEFFQVTIPDLAAGSTSASDVSVELDGWMIKPSTFDPARRYPVIVYVYGEPAGQTTTNRWLEERGLFHRYMAEQGYIVVSIDNRGTPAPKGSAWRHSIYGTIGVLAADEQAAALRALAAHHSYLDLERVGIWGWSGGGSMTLHGMFRYPDLYKVGVSLAPMPDQRYYDTIYQERYMGTPQDNPDGYKRGSPITYAEGLKGRLLIVGGTGDDNCHFQVTELLVNRLITLGKQFDQVVYPNRSHALSEGNGTTSHLYSTMARHITDHLAAGGR